MVIRLMADPHFPMFAFPIISSKVEPVHIFADHSNGYHQTAQYTFRVMICTVGDDIHASRDEIPSLQLGYKKTSFAETKEVICWLKIAFLTKSRL